MNNVCLSLGSNLGNRLQNLLEAIKQLVNSDFQLLKISSIYLTEPIGPVEQDDFYNMVILGKTKLTPKELLQLTQGIENIMGRTRLINWGPRLIDIDILFYNEYSVEEENLIIPHPRIKERAFVLVPLKELDYNLFKKLQTAIPQQKIALHLKETDVKMMLIKEGITVG